MRIIVLLLLTCFGSVRAEVSYRLSADLAAAIAAGDVAALQRIVLPAVQADPSLGTWLGQPGVGDWLTGYLQRLRVELVGTEPATVEPAAPPAETEPADDDPIL